MCILKRFNSKATIDCAGSKLDKLNVNVEPEQVKVKVPVQSPEKPSQINRTKRKSTSNDVLIESIQYRQTKEIVIYGKKVL